MSNRAPQNQTPFKMRLEVSKTESNRPEKITTIDKHSQPVTLKSLLLIPSWSVLTSNA